VNGRPVAVRVGPIARLSLGLVALLIGLVVLADVTLGVVPGQGETQRRVRQRVAENLALQITALLEADDTGTLGKTIQGVLGRDADIRSVTVRRSDGVALVQRGPSLAPEAAVRAAASTVDRLRVPVMAASGSAMPTCEGRCTTSIRRPACPTVCARRSTRSTKAC
jgi:hypothetical protein